MVKEGINDKGFALLVSLMIVAILSSLAFRFHHLVIVNHSSTANLRDIILSYNTARSGFEASLSILSSDNDQVDSLLDEWSTFHGSEGLPSIQVNGGNFYCKIVDENRKIALNRLILPDGKVNQRYLDILMRLFDLLEIDRDLIDSLLDWLDKDSERRPKGAEDIDYMAMDEPYPCKNGPLATLSELSLIKGFSEWMKREFVDGKTLEDFLTVAPTDGKININTADPVLLQALSKRISHELAMRVVDFRKEHPFHSPGDLKLVRGMEEIYGEIKDIITVSSDCFSLAIRGEVSRASTWIFATIKREDGRFRILNYRRT
jgi:general secretion pathway protein K